jgi:hypothetical protein
MLYLLLIEKEKMGESVRGLFPGQMRHIGGATPGFSWLFGVIQICFKGQSLCFLCS